MSDEGLQYGSIQEKNKFTNASINCISIRVIVGLLLYGQDQVANYIKPFGDVFLNLIK